MVMAVWPGAKESMNSEHDDGHKLEGHVAFITYFCLELVDLLDLLAKHDLLFLAHIYLSLTPLHWPFITVIVFFHLFARVISNWISILTSLSASYIVHKSQNIMCENIFSSVINRYQKYKCSPCFYHTYYYKANQHAFTEQFTFF